MTDESQKEKLERFEHAEYSRLTKVIDSYPPSESLQSIGTKHQTDNATLHGYFDKLEPYLTPMREQPIRVLEMGIGSGACLKTWAEFFPNAEIWGVDHNEAFCRDAEKLGDRIHIVHADVSFAEGWDKIKAAAGPEPFSLLVEDSSHTTFTIYNAHKFGFPLLRSGGIFVALDLHASYLRDYQRDNHLCGLPLGASAVEILSDLSHKALHECGLNQTAKPSPDAKWEFCHFWKSMCIISKA